MMKTFNDLKYKYSSLNALEKIIAINAVLFIITLLLGVAKLTFIKDWFALPADFFDFLLQPWSIITYGFLHAGLFHVLFNMLMLFYFGRILLNLLSEKIVLSVFFMGIITGGLAFLTFYNLAPENILVKTSSMVGASAGLRALLMFICIYLPYTQIRIFTFNVKLLYIMYAFIFFDVIGLIGPNQGGNIAHIGGFMLGYVYAKQLQKGNDIGLSFQGIMGYIGDLFSSKPKRKVRMRTVYKSDTKKMAGVDKKEFAAFNKQKQIDAILDKISKSGYDSLTAEEKEFLFKAGKD